ncbi:hypothetical protein ACQJBY_056315 [Aegilops geniculata]
MDQEHLDFIMRHHHQQGGMGFVPVDRGDSEEALGSSESEPAGRPRGKRARAAEVHNLSEKRRRCKINEKMKALQSLVPNSSKLTEVMLYGPPAPAAAADGQSLHARRRHRVPQAPPAPSAGKEPMHQFEFDCYGSSHFDLCSDCYDSVPDAVHEEWHVSSLGELTRSSWPSADIANMIFQEEAMLKHRLSSTQDTTSMPGNEMKPVGQETPAARAGHFDACSIWKNQSQDMTPNNPESVLFAPHLRRFGGGTADSGLRAESK